MRLSPPTAQRLRHVATTAALVFTGALAMAQAQVNTDLPPTAAGPGTSPTAAEMFAKVDTNHDGKLSREECQALPAIAGRFDTLDKDKDGSLSLEEFTVGFKPESK
ncbi:MAG: EF-hand domain-containing protein [Burkholderiaceae bacterium]